MKVPDYVARLREHGAALAGAAELAGLDREVPTAPGWTVRDLVGHTGGVHRWAVEFVKGRTEPPTDSNLATPPEDDQLIAWFTAGCEELASALDRASPDLDCWTFFPAPTPLAFWARRQAHETAVHRIDAESAAGTTSAFDVTFAVDGVDELLLGFFARPKGRLVTDPPRTLGVQVTDGRPGDEWQITIGPTGREVTRGISRGDCVVSGPADAVYRVLWNRGDPSTVKVSGNTRVFDLWQAKAHVTWR
jgi:uncharacterized protein (TIGR03083 family)